MRRVKHLTLDFTTVNTYRACPQKYAYSYVEGKGPVAPSDALTFGQVIHKALAEWHKGGDVGEEATCEHNFKDFCDSGLEGEYKVAHDCARCRSLATYIKAAQETHLKLIPEGNPRSLSHGMNLLWAYYKTYGSPHSAFIPKVSGETFQPLIEVHLSAPLTDRITYTGNLDLIGNHVVTGAIIGVEHKTTYYLNEAFLNKAKLSDQVTGYIYLLQESHHPDISGILWNCLQTAPKKVLANPSECFSRVLTRRTPDQLSEWKDNVLRTASSMIRDLEEGKWVKNMPDACTSWNTLCAFADVCNAPSSERSSILAASYASFEWPSHKIEWEDE